MGVNVAQLVRTWALRTPDRIAAVVWEEGTRRELSYAQLDLRARRAAARFAALGFTPQSRVAVSVQNGVAFLDAWFGGLYQGLTLLPVPPMSAPPELAFRLQHASCAGLVCDASTLGLGQAALALHAGAQLLDAAQLAQGADDHPGPLDLSPESLALVLYTSGTTG
ncbi:MAG TPA: class I adenylate-forming enzyme family protein, partial [Polyangiales bacterium]